MKHSDKNIKKTTYRTELVVSINTVRDFVYFRT